MTKKQILLIGVILVVLVGAGVIFANKKKFTVVLEPSPQPTVNNLPMNITSPSFQDNQDIPLKYTCDGDGVNPPLDFTNIPKDAQSLALTMKDPDAPSGSWVHWLLWNIPASSNQVAENSVPPQAIQGKGSSGQNVYGGPCPPSGTHHYIFTLFALDSKLTLPSYSEAADLEKAMNGHIITQADLVGLYSKK